MLQGLARCLAASVHRPHDLVSRIGGEEFAVLLPDTNEAGARRIAETIHVKVAMLAIGSADIGAGAISVSIGLAATAPGDAKAPASTNLYRLADGALYEAKQRGRNRTHSAKPVESPIAQQTRALQLVSAS